MWKRVHRNGEKNLPWAFKDCTRLLHISLLPRDIIIFKCTKIQYHIWYWILVHLKMMYTVPEVWCVTDVTFISWLGLFFFLFTPPAQQPKKSKWEKNEKKKLLEISSFYTYIPKIMIRWCTVPEKWCATDRQMDRWKKWYRGGCPTL